MSVREDILNNIETALNGITIDGGYNYNIGLASRDASGIIDLDQSRIPAISIIDDGGETPESPVGTNRRVRASISMEGVVKTTIGLSTMFNQFLSDIRRCIHASDFGSNVIYHRLGELEIFTGKDVIYFIQHLEVVYYYPEDIP